MDIGEVLRIAFRTLGRNKLRTCLTMLGIIIGVTAVICIVSLGTSASNEVTSQIQSLGDNMLFIQAGSVNTGGFQAGIGGTKTLVVSDADAIETQIPNITFVSPEADTNTQVVYTNQNWATRVQGVGENYFAVRNWPVMAGSAFSKRDVDSAADVCVIGSSVASRLFGDDDPIGKLMRVKNLPVEVIGELKTKGQSTFGQDQDDVVMMPYTTVMKKLAGVDWLQTITASVDLKENMNVAKDQTEALLRQRHHLRTDEDDD